VSNREMCRDELLALLREASSLRQSFGRSKHAAAVSPTGALLALRPKYSPLQGGLNRRWAQSTIWCFIHLPLRLAALCSHAIAVLFEQVVKERKIGKEYWKYNQREQDLNQHLHSSYLILCSTAQILCSTAQIFCSTAQLARNIQWPFAEI